MHYTGKKNRIARRFGVNIFGKTRNPLLHKQNPPGVHGARRRKKSDFGVQLEEKQKLKAVYGMLTEHQLVRYFKKAEQREGTTAELLIQALESRLDVVVYRMKLANTIFGAQQLVAHGHVRVNGKKVDIRSFRVKPGMKISLKEEAFKIPTVAAAAASNREIPAFLEVDEKALSGTFVTEPTIEQAQEQYPLEINIPIVCEFLAHTT